MYVKCTVWQTLKQIITGMTNFSNSGKVEMYGGSTAKIITKITRINVSNGVFRAL